MCNSCNTGSDHDHGYGPGTAILCGVIFAVMTILMAWSEVSRQESLHEKAPHQVVRS